MKPALSRVARRWFGVLLCGLPLLAGSCARTAPQAPAPSVTPTVLRATPSPAPTLGDEPATVYSSVFTAQRVVSLVLEGFTDEGSMASVQNTLAQHHVPGVFFISGTTASEHPQSVRALVDAGFTVGNYTLNARKDMQNNDVLTNVHQFRRCQELLAQAAAITPTLFRCNGTEYTREVLQAAAHAGLKAGVMPHLYLNHTSFASAQQALEFVQKLSRGSILSLKLGQVLDADEYSGQVSPLDNRAIDPPPFLSDSMDDTINQTYANIVSVVGWLLDALEAEGYTVLTPEALQATRVSMFDHPLALDEPTLAALDSAAYTLPVTPAALGERSLTALPSDRLTGAVFVGDSLTAGLADYVQWRRQTEPEYLAGAQFLTSPTFSVGQVLANLSADSVHPEVDGVKLPVEVALHRLGARVVYLMPGLADVRNYTPEAFLRNLQLLVYQIRQANPGITLCLLSVPPGVSARQARPTNGELFAFNLALCRFSLQFGLPYWDVAFVLRDAQGNLPDALCVDPETYGLHLNDAGCEHWLQSLPALLPTPTALPAPT